MSLRDKRELMQSMVLQWEKSGLSQRNFAESQGIKYSTFAYWAGKNRKQENSQGAFIQLNKSEYLGQHIRVRYPSGVEVSLPLQVSLQALKELIEL